MKMVYLQYIYALSQTFKVNHILSLKGFEDDGLKDEFWSSNGMIYMLIILNSSLIITYRISYPEF